MISASVTPSRRSLSMSACLDRARIGRDPVGQGHHGDVDLVKRVAAVAPHDRAHGVGVHELIHQL
jgi:hypothetical protein